MNTSVALVDCVGLRAEEGQKGVGADNQRGVWLKPVSHSLGYTYDSADLLRAPILAKILQ